MYQTWRSAGAFPRQSYIASRGLLIQQQWGPPARPDTKFDFGQWFRHAIGLACEHEQFVAITRVRSSARVVTRDRTNSRLWPGKREGVNDRNRAARARFPRMAVQGT